MNQLQFQRMQRNQARRSSGNNMSSVLSMMNNIGRGQEKTAEAIADNAIASQDIDSLNVAQKKIRDIGKNAPFTYSGVINEYANSLDLKKRQIQADIDYQNEFGQLQKSLKQIIPSGGENQSEVTSILEQLQKNHETNRQFVSEAIHNQVGENIENLKAETGALMRALSMDEKDDTPYTIDASPDANETQKAQIARLNNEFQIARTTGDYSDFNNLFTKVSTSPNEKFVQYAGDDVEAKPANLRGIINKMEANLANIRTELDVRYDESKDQNLHDQYVQNFPNINNYMTSSASGELTHFAAPEFLQGIDMHLIRLGSDGDNISPAQRKARLTEPSTLIKDPLNLEKRKRMDDYITSLTSAKNFKRIDERRRMAILDLIRVRKQLIGAIDGGVFSSVSDMEKQKVGKAPFGNRSSR